MLSKGTKKFAIIILVLAAIGGAVVIFGGRTPSSISSGGSSGLVTSSGQPVLPGGVSSSVSDSIDDFAILLSTIETISIDTSLFQNPGYLLLKDNPIELGTDIIGRQNPFAPVGTDPVTASTGNVSIVTVQPGKVTASTAEFTAQVTLSDTQPVIVLFEYGTSDTFGSATTPQTITKTGSVFVTAKNLLPGTLYYVRAVAKKGSLSTPANIMSFTTTGTVPGQ